MTTLRAPAAASRTELPITLNGIQVLRGIAALMVVVYHATTVWSATVSGNMERFNWSKGSAGVDVFFVLSGFVMVYANSRHPDGKNPATKFFTRRVLRVMPMYWLTTIYVYLGMVVRGMRSQIAVSDIVFSFLLLPYHSPRGDRSPLNSVGWTLVYEMFFYLLFAVALALRVQPIRFLAPLLMALAGVGLLNHAGWPGVGLLASPLLLEFLSGMVLAHFAARLRLASPRALAAVACAAAMLLLLGPALPSDSWRVLYWGVPAFLIVGSFVGLEKSLAPRLPRFLLLVGNASYSLYLIHMLVINRMIGLSQRLHLATRGSFHWYSEASTVLLFGSVAVAMGIVAYQRVELPLYRWLQARFVPSIGASQNIVR